MGHSINVFIGKDNIISLFSFEQKVSKITLNQGFSMVFLSCNFHEELLREYKGELVCDNLFVNFDSAVKSLLEKYSSGGMLAYMETDYFGGVGSQTAILYENGRLRISPIQTNDFTLWTKDDNRAINIILKELGVKKEDDFDEFDSVGLNGYRRMSD